MKCSAISGRHIRRLLWEKDDDETRSYAVSLIRRPRKAKCMPGARKMRKTIVYSLISTKSTFLLLRDFVFNRGRYQICTTTLSKLRSRSLLLYACLEIGAVALINGQTLHGSDHLMLCQSQHEASSLDSRLRHN